MLARSWSLLNMQILSSTKKLLHSINLTFIEIAVLLIIVLLAHKVDFSVDYDSDFYFKKEDIYYEYEASKQIEKGENPYLKILEGDMLENDKYVTQLPNYYNFLGFVKNTSDDNFSGFIERFRFILFLSQIIGGLFIFLIFKRQNRSFLGLCGAIIYVFNVWTLNSIIFLKQDVLAIGLLLIAFYFLGNSKYRILSYLFYGLSLGIKYIGIFAFPIFLLPKKGDKLTDKTFALYILTLALVLIIPSIRYVVDDFSSFSRSILFSVTRSPEDSDVVYGYSSLLVEAPESYNEDAVLDKLTPRLPLFIVLALTVVLLITSKIDKGTYLFLSLLVFAIFNPVIFPQYTTWIPPFALFPLLNKEKP